MSYNNSAKEQLVLVYVSKRFFSPSASSRTFEIDAVDFSFIFLLRDNKIAFEAKVNKRNLLP